MLFYIVLINWHLNNSLTIPWPLLMTSIVLQRSIVCFEPITKKMTCSLHYIFVRQTVMNAVTRRKTEQLHVFRKSIVFATFAQRVKYIRFDHHSLATKKFWLMGTQKLQTLCHKYFFVWHSRNAIKCALSSISINSSTVKLSVLFIISQLSMCPFLVFFFCICPSANDLIESISSVSKEISENERLLLFSLSNDKNCRQIKLLAQFISLSIIYCLMFVLELLLFGLKPWLCEQTQSAPTKRTEPSHAIEIVWKKKRKVKTIAWSRHANTECVCGHSK